MKKATRTTIRKQVEQTKQTAPVNHARTPFRVVLHAVGTAVGGFIVALALAALGGWLGGMSDPSGWSQLAWSVVGALLGFPLGVYIVTLGLGAVMRFGGSWLGGLIGTIIGVGVLFAALRYGSGSTVSLILGALAVVLCSVIGYHAPWRAK